jgi:hypothetical protein
MEKDRILFQDNPWPEGHPIKVFAWDSKLVDGDVWFDFYLETADYNGERYIEENEDIEYNSDWEAPIIWSNYHRCILSSNYWHCGGFRVCPEAEYSFEYLDGLELEIDINSKYSGDLQSLAFHIYLLGHDAVAKHKVKFIRSGDTNRFDIQWSGKIALAYAGDYEFKHDFIAMITDVAAPNYFLIPWGNVS